MGNQDNVIFTKQYDGSDKVVFPVNRREVWRYSGYMGLAQNVDCNLEKLLDEIIVELKDSFQFKVCYRRMDLEWNQDMPILPFDCQSKDLTKCLQGCHEVVLFAATIGLEIDRKIARYERFAPTKTLLMHAYGAERIEALCDKFCEEFEKEVLKDGLSCTNRFSPGYGDLPLQVQQDFFTLMDCNRKIGVSLNESLLMTPSKSVTAIFGISSCRKHRNRNHNCSQCNNLDCAYRDMDGQ